MKLVLYGAGGPVAAAAIAEWSAPHPAPDRYPPPEVPTAAGGRRPGRALAGPPPP